MFGQIAVCALNPDYTHIFRSARNATLTRVFLVVILSATEKGGGGVLLLPDWSRLSGPNRQLTQRGSNRHHYERFLRPTIKPDSSFLIASQACLGLHYVCSSLSKTANQQAVCMDLSSNWLDV